MEQRLWTLSRHLIDPEEPTCVVDGKLPNQFFILSQEGDPNRYPGHHVGGGFNLILPPKHNLEADPYTAHFNAEGRSKWG